jgi:hypothetical protein
MRPRIVVLACLLAAAGATHATRVCADDAAIVRAREAFESGARLASEGRWKDALALFSLSSSLRPHAMTTYNIAFCERALGRATRARQFFTRALAEDDARDQAELTADFRAAIARYLVELESEIVRIRVELVPAIARVAIDGRPLELAPPVKGVPLVFAGTAEPGPPGSAPSTPFWADVDAGPHEVVVSWGASTSRVFHVSIEREAGRTLTLEAPVVHAPDDGKLATRGVLGLGLAGAGVAAIGVGVGFAFAASASWRDAKAACPDRTACPDDHGSELSARAQVRAHVATALFVAGGAATLSGLVLYFTSRRHTATIGGAGGPSSAGLTFGLSF